MTRCQTIKSRVVSGQTQELGPGKQPGFCSYPMYCVTWAHYLVSENPWQFMDICLNPAKGWVVLIPLGNNEEKTRGGQRAQLGRGRASVLHWAVWATSGSGSCVSVVKTLRLVAESTTPKVTGSMSSSGLEMVPLPLLPVYRPLSVFSIFCFCSPFACHVPVSG